MPNYEADFEITEQSERELGLDLNSVRKQHRTMWTSNKEKESTLCKLTVESTIQILSSQGGLPRCTVNTGITAYAIDLELLTASKSKFAKLLTILEEYHIPAPVLCQYRNLILHMKKTQLFTTAVFITDVQSRCAQGENDQQVSSNRIYSHATGRTLNTLLNYFGHTRFPISVTILDMPNADNLQTLNAWNAIEMGVRPVYCAIVDSVRGELSYSPYHMEQPPTDSNAMTRRAFFICASQLISQPSVNYDYYSAVCPDSLQC